MTEQNNILEYEDMNNDMNNKTTQLTINAMLAALCAVFGYISLDFGNLKITFESVPVLMAALMYGPVSGALVGGIGTLIYQILRYGVSATTLLWMLPYIAAGLIAGAYAKKSKFNNTNKQIVFIIAVMEIMIFAVNTAVILIDSLIYGYYSAAYVFGSLGVRFVLCIGKSIVFGIVMPGILKKMSRITHNGRVRA